jgi:hypothetical protein
MSKQVDERRVIQRMDKIRNRWEEDTDTDGGYVTWREVLKLAIFLLVHEHTRQTDLRLEQSARSKELDVV